MRKQITLTPSEAKEFKEICTGLIPGVVTPNMQIESGKFWKRMSEQYNFIWHSVRSVPNQDPWSVFDVEC